LLLASISLRSRSYFVLVRGRMQCLTLCIYRNVLVIVLGIDCMENVTALSWLCDHYKSVFPEMIGQELQAEQIARNHESPQYKD